jgi:outer membrane receptor protein involved in Fe transport
VARPGFVLRDFALGMAGGRIVAMDWRKQAIVLVLSVLAASAATAGATATTQPSTSPSGSAFSTDSADFGSLSIEDLLNVSVTSAAGLTATDVRHMPVDVTHLDARDIWQSGAKNLDDLIEMYVPNAEVIDHNSPGNDLGFRGIISDTDDEYLYQVNGITMNNRMVYGANNERETPLLGDINSVDVVTGPASATYGSGALSGVIDTRTYSGLTFQGEDLTVKQGIVDQFTTTEVRVGRQFNDTSGLFIYAGYANVQGVDGPMYFGKSYPAKNGLPPYTPGQPFGDQISNIGAAAFNAPYYKFYVDYVNGPWDFWVRANQDGTTTSPARNVYTSTKPVDEPLSEWLQGRSILNDQYTATISYNKDFSDQWNLKVDQSFDSWLAADQRAGVSADHSLRSSYADQLFTRAIGTWTPSDVQSLAFGTEYSHIWYHDPPYSDALDSAPVVTTRDWDSDTISFLAEDQWKMTKQWTLFLSARTDKNTFTGWYWSPRATLVFTPTPKDTLKFIAGTAVRRQEDEDIWGQFVRTGTFAKPETLSTGEVAYEHKFTDQVTSGGNIFYEDYQAVGWDPNAQAASELGHFEIAGGELDFSYRTDATRVTASEGISTLVYGSVPPGSPAASQGISSAPYGYGNQLANWSPSITKLVVTQDIAKRWTANTSIVYYGGFPGAHDYAKYAASLGTPPGATPLSNPGYVTSYGPNLYINMGLEFRPTDQLTLRFDAYNVESLFDQTLSKRNYILRASEFSTQPPSMALSLRYKF